MYAEVFQPSIVWPKSGFCSVGDVWLLVILYQNRYVCQQFGAKLWMNDNSINLDSSYLSYLFYFFLELCNYEVSKDILFWQLNPEGLFLI